ncbi:hypothetical protein LZ554_004147 [Drepanopeziza brunnea f. sp. 'monogermtubi']|nr:hypothetical protein LZ554_004147 [Drepanopeziza brunnea f. sp. 'monogermtubi']
MLFLAHKLNSFHSTGNGIPIGNIGCGGAFSHHGTLPVASPKRGSKLSLALDSRAFYAVIQALKAFFSRGSFQFPDGLPVDKKQSSSCLHFDTRTKALNSCLYYLARNQVALTIDLPRLKTPLFLSSALIGKEYKPVLIKNGVKVADHPGGYGTAVWSHLIEQRHGSGGRGRGQGRGRLECLRATMKGMVVFVQRARSERDPSVVVAPPVIKQAS